MTRKTNRCPAFMEGRGTRCLKIAAVATLLLWCTQPMQAVANTNETQETTDIQQQKVKTTGVVVDENGEPLIGVSGKVLPQVLLLISTDASLSIPPKEQFSHFRLLVIKLLP